MITVPSLAADALSKFLTDHMKRAFSSSDAHLTELVPMFARLALECLGKSDALYHNVEHTMLVTLAGRDILRGRMLYTQISASDYAHLVIACLFHDIGYVRGVLLGDDEEGCVVDRAGRKVKLARGASDAALSPYHVDRSILFVLHRLAPVEALDATRIARAIECTRFPVAVAPEHEEIDEEGAIMRAADLIGQLGDPNYLRKANALYYEFEEAGVNRQLGYHSPADLIDLYPQFYWNNVSPHIQTAIGYLNQTAGGRQWIANLYSNVFRAERELNLCGRNADCRP